MTSRLVWRSVLTSGASLLTLALTSVVLAAPAVAQDAEATEARVVVTTEVLGSIVSEVVGAAARVDVLMPPGADPHSWQPSARDAETIFGADLVVSNGLGLEEGLVDVLEQAEAAGALHFMAADHIDVREVGDAHSDGPEGGDHEQTADGDHEEDHEEAADEEDHQEAVEGDHDHGPADPHFWLDPLAMREVVLALGPALAEAGIDVGDRAESTAQALTSLDGEVEAMLADIPAERRVLVSGHESLGYFADRYGFRIVGTVVPGLTTSGEPSARDVAELIDRIREVGATAVFTEIGTPTPVAEAVAGETGARIIEIRDAQLPEGGSYADLIRGLASTIGAALTG